MGQANSFAEIFKFVLQLSESRAFTLVIDEFQNFQKVNPTVFSDMQRDWDLWKRKSHLNFDYQRICLYTDEEDLRGL